MDQSDAWKSDPLVLVQDMVMPVMWMGGRVVINHQLGLQTPEGWMQKFDVAIAALRLKGIAMMTEYGVDITAEDRQVFEHAADQVAVCKDALQRMIKIPPTTSAAEEALSIIQTRMQPAVSAAIDHHRMGFINLVIARQKALAEQTNSAISGLDRISKQIFFISINASVEAARVGDAGRGFLQISTDIRALSQSAQDATRNLSNLVTGSSRLQ